MLNALPLVVYEIVTCEAASVTAAYRIKWFAEQLEIRFCIIRLKYYIWVQFLNTDGKGYSFVNL